MGDKYLTELEWHHDTEHNDTQQLTFSITIRKYDIQHNALSIMTIYAHAEYHYAECHK
jgi:hypothetical protein